MAFQESQYADGHEIKLILGGVGIVLLLLVGSTAWQQRQKKEDFLQEQAKMATERAKHPYPDLSANPESSASKADELVRKCKGNILNLETEDYHWLDAATSNHSAEFAEMRYKFLLGEDKKKLAKTEKHHKNSLGSAGHSNSPNH